MYLGFAFGGGFGRGRFAYMRGRLGCFVWAGWTGLTDVIGWTGDEMRTRCGGM